MIASAKALGAEAAHMAALRDQLRGPLKRREQVRGLQRVRQGHLEERVSAEVIVGRRSEQREKLGRRDVVGPQQVESVAFDIVIGIGAGLGRPPKGERGRNAGVAAMFERRNGSRADLRMIGRIERHLQKLGLQFGEPAFLGDKKRKAAGDVTLRWPSVMNGRSSVGQAGMVELRVGLGIAVRGVGDLFAFDRVEQGFHKALRSSALQPERSPFRSATGSSAVRVARKAPLNEAAHAATPESCGIRPPAG